MITLAGPADAGKKVQIGMLSGQAQLQEKRRQAQLQAKPLSSEEREAIQRRREAACQSRPSSAAPPPPGGGRAAELQDILRRRREASEAVATEAAAAEAARGPAVGGGPCAAPAPVAEAAECHAAHLDAAAIQACPRPRAEPPASEQHRPRSSADGAAQPAPRAEPPAGGRHPSRPSAEGAAQPDEETPIVRSCDHMPTKIGSTRPPSGHEALLAGMAAKLDEHRDATERDLDAARQLRNEAASFALCVERLREKLRDARASLGQPAQALCCWRTRPEDGNLPEDPA